MQQSISIHALREEGDTKQVTKTTTKADFYPRPPRGGRLVRGRAAALFGQFLSTPSARRATSSVSNGKTDTAYISIHALREEGDS